MLIFCVALVATLTHHPFLTLTHTLPRCQQPTVTLGGQPVVVTTQPNGYHDSVTFTVPAGQGAAVPVVVTSGGQVSNVLTFAYSLPTLSRLRNGLTPTTSETDGRDAVTLERTVATLNGTNFGLEVSGKALSLVVFHRWSLLDGLSNPKTHTRIHT